jgi:hypothetical protein
MLKPRLNIVFALILLGNSASAAAQEAEMRSPGTASQHLGVEYGVHLFGLTASRSALVPTADDYIFAVRGVADPLGRFGADVSATLRPRDRVSLSAFAEVSTLDDNRFYGLGNRTDASNGSVFYRLEQLRFETGLAARIRLGPERNQLIFGPFYRMLDTDRELEAGLPDGESIQADDGGIIRDLQPYGAGAFRQLGLRADLRLGTEGPETGRRLGVRFYGGGTAFAAALDMREPVLSMYGDVKAFVALPGAGDPVLYVRTVAQRVFGDFAFQDAAYLGGSSSLRGVQNRRFAGDLALLGSAELYGTLGEVGLGGRDITTGVMLLGDVGRVFNDGISLGSRHWGVGGGIWLRDHRTGTELTVSVAEAGYGPRLFVGFGSPFWR